MQLEVLADLQIILHANPTRQWFGQIRQDETATRTFTFEGSRMHEARLTDIRLKDGADNPEAYSWILEDTRDDAEGGLALNITVDATKISPGRFNDMLVVSTNFDEMSEMEFLLSGEVLGPISANPQRLYFGQFEVGKEMTNTVTLKANNNVPFRILDASIEDQEFKVDPWKGDASTEHELLLRFNPDTPRDRARTTLIISTDMDAQQELQIEVHGYQRRTRDARRQLPATTDTRARQRPSTARESSDSRSERGALSINN